MKSKLILFSILLYTQLASAGVFLEALPATNKIYRGRAPRANEMQKLVDTGITSVLIFKNQIKSEVDEEVQQLMDVGLSRDKIYNIPFQWKDIKSEKEACEQVVDALGILQKVQDSAKDKILFHCTVGEDRTGLLAGLMSQLLDAESMQSSYERQMCAKGYAGGNANKPRNVSAAVDKYLTPLYFKMSKMIERGELSSRKLNKKVCRQIESEINENISTCGASQ